MKGPREVAAGAGGGLYARGRKDRAGIRCEAVVCACACVCVCVSCCPTVHTTLVEEAEADLDEPLTRLCVPCLPGSGCTCYRLRVGVRGGEGGHPTDCMAFRVREGSTGREVARFWSGTERRGCNERHSASCPIRTCACSAHLHQLTVTSARTADGARDASHRHSPTRLVCAGALATASCRRPTGPGSRHQLPTPTGGCPVIHTTLLHTSSLWLTDRACRLRGLVHCAVRRGCWKLTRPLDRESMYHSTRGCAAMPRLLGGRRLPSCTWWMTLCLLPQSSRD